MAKKLKPMVRLNKDQIEQKQLFIDSYKGAKNAAIGSSVDANSNVVSKTVATLGAELFKDFHIQINRKTVYDKIAEMFDQETADKYVEWLEDHRIYRHDETAQTPGTPYCVAINMYPFLEHGMTRLGGESKAPKHLESYCGSFINLVFAISSQFAGAVATVEFLLYFHYFAKKDYGVDYLHTETERVKSKLQHVVYSLNQPAAARGWQSVFWNVSVFDRYFYESMFGNFMFPDFTKVDYDEFNEMQKFFLEWLLDERTKSLLTFPVLTEASLNAEDDAKDLEWADFIAEIRAKGLSLFSFNDKNASALSSCCRLSSKFDEDFNDFSFSLGAGGVSTGSTSVITININNVIQKGYDLEETIKEVQKFQVANRKLVEEYVSDGLLPAYSAGFISLDKQFVTLGVLGLNEAAEYLGYAVGNNDAYKNWAAGIFKLFSDLNSEARQKYGIKFNTECVPGESLGVKFANWDKEAGLKVNRDCYNSYMYLPESTDTSIPDKFQLHGGNIAEMQDGGSALHCNLSQLPDKELFRWLRKLAAVYGTKYWTTNVLTSVCEECGHIDMRTVDVCSVCGSTNINWATRVIGYLRKIANYSEGRQKEAAIRYYH